MVVSGCDSGEQALLLKSSVCIDRTYYFTPRKVSLSIRTSECCSGSYRRSDRKAIRLGAIRLPSLDLSGRRQPDLDSYRSQRVLERGSAPTAEILGLMSASTATVMSPLPVCNLASQYPIVAQRLSFSTLLNETIPTISPPKRTAY